MAPHNEVLSAASAGAGCSNHSPKSKVKSVTKVVSTKVRKTTFKKAKAKKALRAMQAILGGVANDSHTDSSISN